MVERLILATILALYAPTKPVEDIIVVKAKPSEVSIHWKDKLAAPYRAFSSLFYHNPQLTFATNTGMIGDDLDNAPLGLYVESGKMFRPVQKDNTSKQEIGMQPSGVFLITKDDVAMVVPVNDPAIRGSSIKHATQSVPMLVIGGTVNPMLTKSAFAKRRNGVGILKNGNVLLIISRREVAVNDFAQMFVERGCVSALQLDSGITSGMYNNPREIMWNDGCRCYGPFIGITKEIE